MKRTLPFGIIYPCTGCSKFRLMESLRELSSIFKKNCTCYPVATYGRNIKVSHVLEDYSYEAATEPPVLGSYGLCRRYL